MPLNKPIRATVHFRSIIDNKVNNEWTEENRTIYFYRDGPHVSHLGDKHGRKATENPDGTYSVDYNIRSVTKRTGADIFGKPVKL